MSSSEASQARGEPAASLTVYISDGIYLFDVRANNLWTVEISDSEELNGSRHREDEWVQGCLGQGTNPL